MNAEKGNVSINTEDIFPIIKKWLYSDKDIFIRELVSNCSDAISKYNKLVAIGDADAPEGDKRIIRVTVDKENKTIAFADNGIGMTADEVKSYINQIAFSGAKDFIEKYKDKLSEEDQIIGHFGLGFYSSFMVSDKVVIETMSYQDNAEPIRWISEDGTNYSMEACEKSERGTVVTLTLSDEASEYLDGYKVREVLKKYCAFMPSPIFLIDVEQEKEDKEYREKKKEENKGKEGADDIVYDSAPSPVNNTEPLWLKAPKDCTDEDYKTFYRDVFLDFDEPLFWIHLNMEYPFNLKGILYFPKLKHEFEMIEGQVKLYYNQVFVADNVKEVIPEFLLLLKGCLDCPDLPLNVSRSFLQNDSYVQKISTHITKKVADKLTSMFENARDDYNKYWDDINPFIKYGCIKEDKFYNRVKDVVIYKDIYSKYITMKDYFEKKDNLKDEDEVKEKDNLVDDDEVKDKDNLKDEDEVKEKDNLADDNDAKEKDNLKDEDEVKEKDNLADDNDAKEKDEHKGKIFYVTDVKQQSQYIKMFKDNNMNAVILDTLLDNHFITHIESKEREITFSRIDADISDSLKATDAENGQNEDEIKEMKGTLEKVFREAAGNEQLQIKVEPLKVEKVPGFLLQGEFSRRMSDMSRFYGGGKDMSSMFPKEETLVLNRNNRLIREVVKMAEEESKSEEFDLICKHIYDMAVMSNKPLEADAMTEFLERSALLLEKLLR